MLGRETKWPPTSDRTIPATDIPWLTRKLSLWLRAFSCLELLTAGITRQGSLTPKVNLEQGCTFAIQVRLGTCQVECMKPASDHLLPANKTLSQAQPELPSLLFKEIN